LDGTDYLLVAASETELDAQEQELAEADSVCGQKLLRLARLG